MLIIEKIAKSFQTACNLLEMLKKLVLKLDSLTYFHNLKLLKTAKTCKNAKIVSSRVLHTDFKNNG